MVDRNFTPDLRFLQLRPILCLSLSYFGENNLTCMHFIEYFEHQEATVVLDITTQFVASDGNKYCVVT